MRLFAFSLELPVTRFKIPVLRFPKRYKLPHFLTASTKFHYKCGRIEGMQEFFLTSAILNLSPQLHCHEA